MKILIRKSNYNDLENIYNLHIECFEFQDRWYKNAISQYIDNSIVIEANNNIIGILLQGNFIPISLNEEAIIEKIINNFDLKNLQYGIVMICIHPNFRNKNLATKLINIHLNLNNISCLCTRKSNTNALNLYLKNNYDIYAIIKDKYYLPVEDAIFMIHK